MFKDLFTESRDELKAAYLKSKYTMKDVKKLLQDAEKNEYRVYVQYPDKRARNGLGSGDVVNITGDKIRATSKFGGWVEIKPEEIKMMDILK